MMESWFCKRHLRVLFVLLATILPLRTVALFVIPRAFSSAISPSNCNNAVCPSKSVPSCMIVDLSRPYLDVASWLYFLYNTN